MNKDFISALKLSEELNVYLKITTSIKSFDNYNSFYNIYSDSDEPCRRIVVLTPYKEVEEVYDEYPDKPLDDIVMIDGNVWIKEYPLTTNPKNIDLNELYIEKSKVKEIKEYLKR